MKHIKLYEEFINEARSIEKIEKDRTRVINGMAEMVTNWKAAKASGDKEAEISFLQRLKDLTAEKNKFEQELNTAVAGKDRFIELVISENNTIFERAMSEIDLLAKEAKNFKDFVKEFKKDYSDIAIAGDIKELEEWLKSVFDSAVSEEVVSEKKGMYKITKNTEVEDYKIGNKFYNVKKGEKVELIDDDGDIATVKLRSGEIVNIESQFVDESDGTDINEAKQKTYTVGFYVINRRGDDVDYDWDVLASSEAEAIELVQTGKAKGPYGEEISRLARKFSAKLKK
jgi:predicted DNA binding CopG/RHH family protein